MTDRATKLVRCAIYTRKSTEHGLELEFNSLDAQRDACEAYIKSQFHDGWRALPARYDDPAYSGGNLDRPALQKLLGDIDAGRIDVVVVYKIDRLTRSLADFAKLVEAFDKKSISFVAVTQQFNTTTSMGRLTLNVLLSFAQFERELSSERVRDKTAASRKKGKWTGGSAPLGYDIREKKLVINQPEAETVRYIYRRYLDLKCLRHLAADLRDKRIVSKSRRSSSGRNSGGVPLTYGPLSYLLKNRIYLGDMGHKGAWYRGEHDAIIDSTLFSNVQGLLKSNAVNRRLQRTDHQSLLKGLLFDDRGNRMSPSFSSKRGVRYRFYVSTAVTAGRRDDAGSMPRISAPDMESTIVAALRQRFAKPSDNMSDQHIIGAFVERMVVNATAIQIMLKAGATTETLIEIARPQPPLFPRARIDDAACKPTREPEVGLTQALARAHFWRRALSDGTHQTVEELARFAKWNPKVVRKALRLAFLAPDLTEAIILGTQPQRLGLSELQSVCAYSWDEQRRSLGFPARSGQQAETVGNYEN